MHEHNLLKTFGVPYVNTFPVNFYFKPLVEELIESIPKTYFLL